MPDHVPIVHEPLVNHEGFHEGERPPADGIGLCLSGGGYRAMLFHVGTLWRLNELGLLSRIDRISSVSGGSITAGALGVGWKDFSWNQDKTQVTAASFREHFVEPVRRLARQTIDLAAIGWGILSPFSSIGDQIADAYDETLFHGATLADLPDDWSASVPRSGGPRLVINATNVQTGSLWRFSKPYMADYRVGLAPQPTIALSQAVAASSAFPPFLSPVKLNLSGVVFKQGIPAGPVDSPLRREAVLTDGGVYDNLGLEPIWKRYRTVLVSDAGRRMQDDLSPATDWARHSRRLIDLLQSQISSLRRKQVVQSYRQGERLGAYWGIQTDIAKFQLPSALDCPYEKTRAIAAIDTRLAAMSERDQERLINWGYAVCDAAVRRHVAEYQAAARPAGFPHPATGL
ncbi:MAG TPA: patatin-like phospholipase family protein [Pirellulaceae bacterium]|nr:patatin-like phospholipase family protein [Pirellulaceae bacterium]